MFLVHIIIPSLRKLLDLTFNFMIISSHNMQDRIDVVPEEQQNLLFEHGCKNCFAHTMKSLASTQRRICALELRVRIGQVGGSIYITTTYFSDKLKN